MGQLSTAKVSDSPFIIKGKGASMWEKENIQLWGADTCWLGKIKGAVVKMSVIWLKVGQLCYSPIQARWIHTYHQVEADTGMGKDFTAKVGATMLLTYARRCICDARYSGQNLKRVGILRQGGNILPLSIQRGNLQPYIFRGQHITSYILMGGILPPPLLLIYEPKIGNGYLKRLKAQKGKGGAVSLFIAKHIRVSSRRDCYLFLKFPTNSLNTRFI